jgi:hypothetical protein
MTGPVHAEVRVNDQGIWILEVAARSIGGLCGRALTHLLGMSLEELILRQAVAESPPSLPAGIEAAGEGGAAGVMMIPIPRRGIYHGLEGLAAAQSVPGVTGVTITAEPGQIIAPPPDEASYLGFIFARAASPAEAENALRIAHRSLHFDIRREDSRPRTRSLPANAGAGVALRDVGAGVVGEGNDYVGRPVGTDGPPSPRRRAGARRRFTRCRTVANCVGVACGGEQKMAPRLFQPAKLCDLREK